MSQSMPSRRRAIIARRHLFSSAHLYNQPAFSPEKNREVFGRCHTTYGHGHNYVLELFLEGPIDPRTKMIMNLTDLDAIMKDVIDPLDHQHLNFDVPYFKNKIPTTENIAIYLHEQILERLKRESPLVTFHRLKLFETDDLWTEITAEVEP